jgi:hypothetical protein
MSSTSIESPRQSLIAGASFLNSIPTVDRSSSIHRRNEINTNIGRFAWVAIASSVLLGACAGTPMGPTVQVLPGSNTSFEIFKQDQEECNQYAQTQVAGQAESANRVAVGSALLSAALGTAVGVATGNGPGAGIGAAIGGLVGTGIGASNSQGIQATTQIQYNNAYMQCMYAKGHLVPGAPPPPPAPPQLP